MAVVKVTLRSGVKCLTNLKSLSRYLYIDTNIKTLGAIFDVIATLINTAAIFKYGGCECRSRSRSKRFKISTPIYVYIEKVSV